MKKVAALLLVLLAATALVACGGSDDDTSSTPAETSEATTGEGGGGATAADVLAFEAAEGTDLAYTSDTAESAAGKVSIEFTNPQAISHDVSIEDPGGKEVAATELVSDGTATATADLKPGDYTFFCTVPGHREAGMEGTLTVK